MSNVTRRAFVAGGVSASLALAIPVLEAAVGAMPGSAAPRTGLPRLQVHSGGHYLQTTAGQPFFWLADTAWQLLHELTVDECRFYLRTRARQGFTVVQIVTLCEFDGIAQPNALGLLPFLSVETLEPNPSFFDHLVQVVELAAEHGLYVALLPTWGDKLTAPWGEGPRLFTVNRLDRVRRYAAYLAGRVRHCSNVLWMLGGDRPAWTRSAGVPNQLHAPEDWRPIWDTFAEVLRAGSETPSLVLYHPQGGEMSTSVLLSDRTWLDVNGMQSGHGGGRDQPVWRWVARDAAQRPAKPTIDLEPNYEDHPVNPWPQWNPADGYFRDDDVRRQIYRAVFAGACGSTYGHHSVWQFAGPGHAPINFPAMAWTDAMVRPGGQQMIFLRDLMQSRPFFTRVPLPDLPVQPEETVRRSYVIATGDSAGSYAMVYAPQPGMTLHLRRTGLPTSPLRTWWYNVRNGSSIAAAVATDGEVLIAQMPESLQDAVLVLDRADAGYAAPGLRFTTPAD